MAEINRISYSGYKCYLTCPKKYEFTYIRNFREQVEDKLITFVGTAVHKLLETYYSNDNHLTNLELFIQNNNVQIFRDSIRKEPMSIPFIQLKIPEAYDTYIQLLRNYCQIAKNSPITVSKPLAESEFAINLKNGVTLDGKIDLIDENSETVIDFKCGQKKYCDKEQLITYSMAYKNKYGHLPKQSGFLFLKDVDGKFYNISETDIENFTSKLNETIEKIQGDYFPTQTSFLCKDYCEHRKRCPAFSDSVKLTPGEFTF